MGVTVRTMRITVYGKQMNVRESLRESIERKLAYFDRFFGADAEAQVTCRVEKNTKILEIMIPYDGTVFRAEEREETFLCALDRAVETLRRQILRNKTRLEKRMRQGAFILTEDEDEYEEETEFHIRRKTFPFKPMTPEEAILQMNLLEHSFYAFTDAQTGTVSVVYRRRDGGYGLIEPQT